MLLPIQYEILVDHVIFFYDFQLVFPALDNTHCCDCSGRVSTFISSIVDLICGLWHVVQPHFVPLGSECTCLLLPAFLIRMYLWYLILGVVNTQTVTDGTMHWASWPIGSTFITP